MSTLKHPFTFEEFKGHYSKVPRITVEVILQNEKGVLLTYRTIEPYKNVWHLPGGTVHFKESLEDAVRRVAKEELGISVTVLRYIGYIDYLAENEGFDRPIGMAFLCHTEDKEIKLDGQAKKFEFFAELPQNTIPVVKRFVQNLL